MLDVLCRSVGNALGVFEVLRQHSIVNMGSLCMYVRRYRMLCSVEWNLGCKLKNNFDLTMEVKWHEVKGLILEYSDVLKSLARDRNTHNAF